MIDFCSENNTGSAGVSPAWIGNDRRINPKGEAGETPALPGIAIIFIHHRVRHRLMRDCFENMIRAAVYDHHSYGTEKRASLESWSKLLQVLVSD
jgi:hypothetical protein